MATWFECKVKYDKLVENGQQKTVTEPYLVDALSFTEAEARIIDEVSTLVNGEMKVTAVKRTNIAEIFWDEADGDRWYKVKVNFIIIDEKTAVEKKTANFIMVQANGFKAACDNFMQGMKGTMADFEIASITETAILDVFKENLGGDSDKAEG
ncbi:MAG: DUF4494 domain-containing protein [Muribaculaceae bacterium]|nr:DUF4494 domain-containing protein [Muribaculaceae bacterium]